MSTGAGPQPAAPQAVARVEVPAGTGSAAAVAPLSVSGPVELTGTGTGAAAGASLRDRAPFACLPAFTRSLSSFPTLKNGKRLGCTLTRTPVRGFRPS